MPYERNIETQDALKREIKTLQANCVNTCHIIENAPPDAPVADSEEVNQKINCYIKGLREEVHNSNTPISIDDNLLTSQFLKEIKEKSNEVDELVAYTKGCILDVDSEINRLKNLIDIANEALSKPKIEKQEVRPEHFMKAKEKFQMMKNEIHGLMQSLLPHCHEAIMEIMGHLMAAKLDNNPDGYVPITTENYQLIELLKDMNIVTANPYNNMEVKLTYF